MSINLSNVNITIQQFQEIASGKYNAGEVKLTSETSLGKINNHVGYGGTNNDTISHDEVLAIKDAFVRARSKSGVGVNALAEIRRRIGLAPDPLSPKALVERSTGRFRLNAKVDMKAINALRLKYGQTA